MAAHDNVILVNTSGGPVTITLPTPTNGRVLKVKDSTGNAGTNNITIVPFASELIDGASSKVINFNYGSVNLVSDGTNWFLDDLSAATGSGTVTSVSLTVPSFLNVSGSPITTSGTLAVTLNSESANTFFAAPNGSSGTPTFRAIVAADIPTLNQNTTGTAANVTATSNSTLTMLSALSLPGAQVTGNISGNAGNITATSNSTLTTLSALALPTSQLTGTISLTTQVSGILPIANGGTNASTAAAAFNNLNPMTTTGDMIYESGTNTAARLPIGSTGKVLTVVGGIPAWATPATSGTVTSVAFADGSTTPIYSISGSPVTSSGTLEITLNTQTANTVFAGPSSGSAAEPGFRALVSADIPDLSATYVTQSEVGAANGVASLDSGGKIPLSQLPSSLMEFKGSWNPNTNTPTLVDGTGTTGFTYWVSAADTGTVAGLTDPSMYNFQIGDLVIYNGTKWVLVTPAAGVQSVNGAQGAVTVNAINQLTGDATAGPASGSQSEVLTLATVNSNVGSFGSSTSIPSFTVNAKGLITAASGNAVVAPAGTLSGTTLNSTVVNSSLTSVGTLTSLTVSGAMSASNFSGSSSGTNTGDITLTAFGSTPNADGASLSGQALTLQPADGTHPGGVSTTTQTFAGSKTIGYNVADQITIGASGSTANQQINGGLQITTNTVSSNYAIS